MKERFGDLYPEALKGLESLSQLMKAFPLKGDGRPVTEGDVRDIIAEAREELREEMDKANAFILAFLQNEPIPLMPFFHPWASKPTILKWEKAGLKLERFNAKTMCRPKAFFAFIERELAEGEEPPPSE